ncbi:MAG TPA: methyltransferase domain-containing protein [bacterium]|nr:methyltransferase domain-containing protein [bacterium]
MELSASQRARRVLLDKLRRLLGIPQVLSEIASLRTDLERFSRAMANEQTTRDIAELRQLLGHVELYQPIFRLGFWEELGPPQRICDDRIASIVAGIGSNLKNLRILDAGSSLGYVSLSLAQHGAKVVGLDSSPHNIAASRIISRLTGVAAEFQQGELNEAFIDQIPSNHYDAGIFFSIFHHIVHARGLERARGMVNQLLSKIPLCFFELALKQETGPYPWKESLPENPLALFDAAELEIELLSFSPTHLSAMRRPLYRVTKKSGIAVNGKIYLCRRTRSKAYAQSPIGTNRRYHFSEEFVIKEVFADSQDSFDGILQTVSEIAILRMIQRGSRSRTIPGVDFSSLVDFEISPQRVCLVLKSAKGELLSGIVGTLDETKKVELLDRLEKTVIHLESCYGIHHNDLRLWNLIFDAKSDVLTLIDFGLASPAIGESSWESLAILAAELDQSRVFGLEDRATPAELELVSWRSPALQQRFERYRERSMSTRRQDYSTA